MLKYSACFLLVLVSFAEAQSSNFQIVPAHSSIRLRGGLVFPRGRSIFPPKQILSVKSSLPGLQPWTIALTGSLSTACEGAPCLKISEEFSNTAISSGSGSRRIAINWLGGAAWLLAPGVYSGTLTLTPAGGGASAAATLTLEVLGTAVDPATPEVKATSFTEVGCDNSNPLEFSFNARCTIPDEAPSSDPNLTRPSVGQAITDPTFGGKIRRMTGPGCGTVYGSTTAFSALSTYNMNNCGIFRTSDAALIRQQLPGNQFYRFMSALDDQAFTYMNGSQIRSYNWITNQNTLLGDMSVAPYNFTTLYAGGTIGATDDDWIAFYEINAGPNPKVCAVDVVALKAAGAPNASNTYCGTYQGPRDITLLDWVGVTPIDLGTGRRFVYLSAIPLSVVFRVGKPGSGELIQQNIVPEWPGWGQNNDNGLCQPGELCYNANNFTHSAIFRDRDGQVKLFGNFEDIWFNRDFLSVFRLNSGTRLLRPREEGGGQNFIGQIGWDRQPGCSSKIHGCVLASIPRCCDFISPINSAVEGQATTVTLDQPVPWTVGTTRLIRIQNAPSAWSCLNGAWTATVSSPTQLQIPANCQGSSGSVVPALLGDATPFPNTAPNRSQIQVWRPGRQVHRIGMHRTVTWNDLPAFNISAYESTPRASLSRDGRFVAFTSNWGSLDIDGPSVYVAETGLGLARESLLIKNVVPGRTRAAISYDIASGRSCSIELSTDPIFATLTELASDSGPATSRTTHLGRSIPLAADSQYWLRLTCGLEVETTSFRTLPAGSEAVRPIQTQVGPSGDPDFVRAAIEYRAVGGSSFASTATLACQQGCTQAWSASLGSVNEYRVVYFNADDTQRREGPLWSLAVNR